MLRISIVHLLPKAFKVLETGFKERTGKLVLFLKSATEICKLPLARLLGFLFKRAVWHEQGKILKG